MGWKLDAGRDGVVTVHRFYGGGAGSSWGHLFAYFLTIWPINLATLPAIPPIATEDTVYPSLSLFPVDSNAFFLARDVGL